MRNFNSGMKSGLIISILAFIVMIVLVLISKSIPNLVFYLFVVGLVIAIASAFIKRKQ